jgi:hypothetical protein
LLKVQAPLRRFSRLGRLLEKTLTVLERWAFLAVMDSGAPDVRAVFSLISHDTLRPKRYFGFIGNVSYRYPRHAAQDDTSPSAFGVENHADHFARDRFR